MQWTHRCYQVPLRASHSAPASHCAPLPRPGLTLTHLHRKLWSGLRGGSYMHKRWEQGQYMTKENWSPTLCTCNKSRQPKPRWVLQKCYHNWKVLCLGTFFAEFSCICQFYLFIFFSFICSNVVTCLPFPCYLSISMSIKKNNKSYIHSWNLPASTRQDIH